jgi:hypothetical protein
LSDNLCCLENQRILRARRYAGATAIAVPGVDLGCCHVVESGRKANRLLVAGIGTGLTNNLALREASLKYLQAQLPWRLDVTTEDRLRTGVYARSAKSTVATPKVDLWKAAGATEDNALGTGADAAVTRSATVREFRLD